MRAPTWPPGPPRSDRRGEAVAVLYIERYPGRDGSGERGGRQAPGDREAFAATRSQHHELAGRRANAGDGEDDGAVRDQDEVAAHGPARGDLTDRTDGVGLTGTIAVEIGERRPRLGPPEGQPRGLEAPAPGAGQHPTDGDPASVERGDDPLRSLAASLGHVPLGSAAL